MFCLFTLFSTETPLCDQLFTENLIFASNLRTNTIHVLLSCVIDAQSVYLHQKVNFSGLIQCFLGKFDYKPAKKQYVIR